VERPKSDNLMCPSLSIRMLSGLISLYPGEPRNKKSKVSFSGYALESPQIVTLHSPMDETKVMYGLDRKNTLCDIEPRHVLREGIVFDQHRHQVSSGQELHDEIQVSRILE